MTIRYFYNESHNCETTVYDQIYKLKWPFFTELMSDYTILLPEIDQQYFKLLVSFNNINYLLTCGNNMT